MRNLWSDALLIARPSVVASSTSSVIGMRVCLVLVGLIRCFVVNQNCERVGWLVGTTRVVLGGKVPKRTIGSSHRLSVLFFVPFFYYLGT